MPNLKNKCRAQAAHLKTLGLQHALVHHCRQKWLLALARLHV